MDLMAALAPKDKGRTKPVYSRRGVTIIAAPIKLTNSVGCLAHLAKLAQRDTVFNAEVVRMSFGSERSLYPKGLSLTLPIKRSLGCLGPLRPILTHALPPGAGG
jgi:hypothetical protein